LFTDYFNLFRAIRLLPFLCGSFYLEWGYARLTSSMRYVGMKLRKRHKIVLLFWVPVWSLALVSVALVGRIVGAIHF